MPTLISSLPSRSLIWIQKSYQFSGILFRTKSNRSKHIFKSFNARNLRVMAATEGSSKNQSSSKEEEIDNGDGPSVPSWARPGSDDAPPWARQEAQKDSTGFELPFYVYLLSSAVAAIAAIGSIFEYVNERPVFGILNSDSVFYAPLLGIFVFVGIPTSAFLWSSQLKLGTKKPRNKTEGMGFCSPFLVIFHHIYPCFLGTIKFFCSIHVKMDTISLISMHILIFCCAAMILLTLQCILPSMFSVSVL